MRFLILPLLMLLCSCGEQRPTLNIYAWAEMFSPQIIKQFEKECGCRVVLDTYDSNEMLYAKLKSGATGYDLILPTYYFEQAMVKQGMLQPIDTSKIPNLKYLDRSILGPIEKTLLQHSVPFSISYTGIGYRKDRIDEPITSWCIFGDKKYKKRMTVLNDYRETLGVALMCLGFSPNTLDQDELKQASNLVIDWKNTIAKFENEQYKNGIATAEFLIVQGYSSDILQVMRENPEVGFTLPREGALISYDQFALPKNAPHPHLAYQFINFMYRPEIAAQNMKGTGLRIPNRESYHYLPGDLKNSPVLFPAQQSLANLQLIEDLGDNIRLYQKAWERVKESW